MSITENLMSGFLSDRNQDTFVYADTSNRLGWEDDLVGDSYSDFLFKGESKDFLASKKHRIAHGMCRNVVSVMDIDKKINVSFDSQDNFYDGHSIFVSTQVLDDDDLSMSAQIDVIKGLAIHETAHADSTDMDRLKEFTDGKDILVKTLFNVIEDERIERIVGEKTPGYSRFLEKTKSYMFDKKYIDTLGESDYDISKESDEEKLFDTILKMIRFPNYLDENLVAEFSEELFEIKDLFLESFDEGYPYTQEECESAVSGVYKIIENFSNKKKKEDSSSSSSEGDSTPSSAKLEDKLSSSLKQAISKTITSPDETYNRDEVSEFVKDNNSEIKITEGSADYDANSKVLYEKAPIDLQNYAKVSKRVSPYASTLSKVLRWQSKNKIDTLTRLKTGSLDTNFLAEARQRVDNIYFRTRKIKSQKIGVCLLIDESGSMRGSNIKSAIEGAVLFIEALKKVPHVDLYVYGHTADLETVAGDGYYPAYDQRTNVIIYKEPGIDNEKSVVSAKGRCQNRDGVAIIEVAKRVRKFTKDKILYLVLSDGAPSANSYRNGVEHTRKCVKQAEKLDMEVMQIAIESHTSPEKMFTNFVKFTDTANLATNMGRLLRKMVTKLSSDIIE